LFVSQDGATGGEQAAVDVLGDAAVMHVVLEVVIVAVVGAEDGIRRGVDHGP
jgi:hypothetical protein